MDIDPKSLGSEVKRYRALARLSQEELADRSGVGQSTIDRIEKGEFRRVPPSLYQIATALGLTVGDFDPALADATPQRRPQAGAIIPGERLVGADRDFPIHASAEGGAGEIIFDTQPVEFTPRPSIVASVRGAYGLIVTGSSMEPEFEAGDTAIINPHLPVVPGGTYIFYAEKDGQARATIKRLRRATADSWLVRQHNPAEGQKHDFALSRREWTVVHRVLGKHYR
jgi:phage repressor protein C with HTH and peptisase S24 domain